jgi:hypothetical protein
VERLKLALFAARIKVVNKHGQLGRSLHTSCKGGTANAPQQQALHHTACTYALLPSC